MTKNSDRVNFFQKLKQLLRLTYNRMGQVNIGVHGAAIAFLTIFSIAPVIIILLWIISLFLGSQLGQAELRQTISFITGPDLAHSIESVVVSSSRGNSGLFSSIAAVIALLFGATTLLSQLKQTLNLIWGVSDPQIHTVWQYLWDRLVGLLFIGMLSILFLGGLIAESVLYGMSEWLNPAMGSQDLILYQYGSSILNILLAFIFFAAMFRFLPDIRVRFRDIAVGAAVTTALVLVGKALIDWYLTTTSLQPAYRAAGSFVIFLIWIYYNVQMVLLGAVFTSVFTHLYGGKVRPYWSASLDDDWYLGSD